jgi:hypothetical protein
MAVTRAGSVIKVTADNDTVSGPIKVCGIKYIAGTGSPSASIKAGSTSGNSLWETAATTEVFEEVEFYINDTLHFDLAGTGTAVYLYLE